MNVLLVEPDFPYPNKSKNKANGVHKNFVPIGLLKLGAMYKAKGNNVKLVRGLKTKKGIGFVPDNILITSLFTYWSKYVWDSIEYYRNLYPHAIIELGGIYATLHADTEKFKNLSKKFRVKVHKGISKEAEKYLPDYSLIPKVDYHATHMMRGCIRRCKFCGTWRLEPKLTAKTKDEIIRELKEIGKNKVIFYDNNLLANPHVKEILKEFETLRINSKPVIFESQSGFDGRLLKKDPELATLLKKARFQNMRIAWDNSINDAKHIKKQVDLLVKVGYPAKDISIFMIYNFDMPYEDMLKKMGVCKKWGVQIIDCRNRPLDLDYDGYKPHMRKGQPNGEYYIHKQAGWTDKKIRKFRSKVRQHNIWIRYAKDKGLQYDRSMEKWSAIHNTFKFFNLGRPPRMEKIERSPKIIKRINILNSLKNYYKSNNLNPPNFCNHNKEDLDKLLKRSFAIESSVKWDT
jgi:hypothetical protein